MKKSFIILLVASGVLQTHALVISEIMYDPQGSDTSREWVEVYNDSNNPIDLTTWKFFESGTNHSITSYSGGGSMPAGAYAVVADNPIKFLEDYPSYTGILYDSAYSLSNSGEHLAFKESSSGPEVVSVDYNASLGGNNDGSTLSKIDGVWTRGSATPGKVNLESLASVDTPTLLTSTTSNTQATVAQMSPPVADIVFYMPYEKTVVAGAESTFSTFGLTHKGDMINNLTYTWAFGDGGQGTGSTTLYRYVYPGKYIAQVEGTNGYVLGTGRMHVKVVPPDIAITKIGVGKYGPYVDVANPNSYDLDISQWKLSINGAAFSFPKNTLIIGKETTHFSGLAMGFASTTISSSTVVRILFPNQEEVTRYEGASKAEQTYVTTATTSLFSSQAFIPSKAKPITVQSHPLLTTIKAGTTSLPVLFKQNTTKDTRIVSFFKSLFGKNK